jgi:hypothetical protein
MKSSPALPTDISLARCLLYSSFQGPGPTTGFWSRDLEPPPSLGRQMLYTVENIVELMEYTQDSDRLKEFNKQQIAFSDRA